MNIFKDFVLGLNEVLITLGKQPYPLFGNVVILAGGAASGKGFVKNKLLAIEGINCDVDAIKELALKSQLIKQRAKTEYGLDLSSFNLKNPDNVSTLHSLMVNMKVLDKRKLTTYMSILASDPERKPNIIFDVTLKDITKLNNLTTDLSRLGYDKSKIHIVWVVNDVKLAAIQNKERDRVVSDDILLDTHEGVALTMKKIIDMGDKLKSYMDGSIVLAFNKRGEDTDVEKSKNGGMFVKGFNYVVIKEPGKPVNLSKITDEILAKIKEYTPKINTW
jgi:hypothetical protein